MTRVSDHVPIPIFGALLASYLCHMSKKIYIRHHGDLSIHKAQYKYNKYTIYASCCVARKKMRDALFVGRRVDR